MELARDGQVGDPNCTRTPTPHPLALVVVSSNCCTGNQTYGWPPTDFLEEGAEFFFVDEKSEWEQERQKKKETDFFKKTRLFKQITVFVQQPFFFFIITSRKIHQMTSFLLAYGPPRLEAWILTFLFMNTKITVMNKYKRKKAGQVDNYVQKAMQKTKSSLSLKTEPKSKP